MALNIGFIGLGLINSRHLENIARMSDARVAAVCDVIKEKADAVGKQYGATPYTDHKQMLEREKLDALYIAIPPNCHTDQELDAIEHGIPFLVEKPVTLDLELGRRIAAAVTKKGLITACGYHFRYNSLVDIIRRKLEGREVGLVLGWWMGGLWIPVWWRIKEQSGGQLVEQCTHMVDLSRYLVGDVKSVYALASHGLVTDVESYTLDDASTVNLKYKSGAVGNITSTAILEKGHRTGLTLVGRRFVADFTPSLLRVTEGKVITEYALEGDPLVTEDETFTKAVRTGDPSAIRSPYADALKTTEVTLAANRSMETGEIVRL